MFRVALAALAAVGALGGAAENELVQAAVAKYHGLVVTTLEEAPSCDEAFGAGFRGTFRFRLVDTITDEVVQDEMGPEGRPFSMWHGQNETPYAFDLGVEGMCVGETRRISVPAGLAPPRTKSPKMEFSEVVLDRVARELTADEITMWTAVKNGDSMTLQRVFEDTDVDVNAPDPITGGSPLFYAVARGNMELFAVILNRQGPVKADVNQASHTGHTPLFYASGADNKEMLEALLLRGADATAALPETGETPLHFAARAHLKTNVEMLTFYGADLHARTHDGLKAGDYSEGRSMKKKLEDLESSSSSSSSPSSPSSEL